MSAPPGIIRTGIGGWVFPAWRGGTFYPAGLPQREELAYASGQLGCIEIDGVGLTGRAHDQPLALVGGDTRPTAIFVPAVRKYEKVLLNHEFDGFYREPIRWLRRFSGEFGGNGLPL